MHFRPLADHLVPLRPLARAASFALALVLTLGTASTAAAVCGDMVLDPGEDCEAPFDACCNATTCLFESAATVCRTGSGDSCDPDELCTGSSAACPSDVVTSGGTECYAGSGDSCDPAKQCTGVAGEACPAATTEPNTTVCRAGSGDICDPDELCTGNPGEACPSDVVTSGGTECYAGSGDSCDPAKQCTGVATEACPAATTEPNTTVCRAGSGDSCDPAELCTGLAGQACPSDTVAPSTQVCRAGSGDSCDPDELCTGVAGQTCPSDTVAPSTQTCRTGSGDSCDPDELCTGVAGQTCPSDTVSPSTQVCRTGSGDSCDPDELCTGNAGEACPADSVEPATTVCRTGSGDSCDPDELCTGNAGEACPADSVEPATTVCRAGSGDLCDVDELCTGNAGEACPTDVFEPDTTVCRAGSGDLCDPDELCPGTAGSACPGDFVEPDTTVCRAGSGDPNGSGFICDPDELCTGTIGEACPSDTVETAGTVCNAGSGDPNGSGFVCDPEEVCSGTVGDPCPVDTFSDATAVCRSGGGSFDGTTFTCDAAERCPGSADDPCPPDTIHSEESFITVRAMRDARTMETHRTSNNGATGLFWLKRSPNVRGIIGFDTSCQAAAMDDLDCGMLNFSIHDGLPTLTGASFSLHTLNVPWVEGNQAFDSFSWKGQSLGSFPGTGQGTTWGCRIDLDLDDSGSHNCDTADRWWGGDICGAGKCFTEPSSADSFYADGSQQELPFDLTSDLVGHQNEISYIMKVTDEEDIQAGSVKLYQRDGARFIAETDPATPPHVAFDLAPTLRLYGPGLSVPVPVLVEPVSQGAIGSTIDVALDQVGPIGGDAPRWENKTLGTWGYLTPGVIEDWEATIPLQSGPNEVEFTMFDGCNTEGQATYTLTSAAGEFCGNGIIEAGEECDDGNGVSGDCCSGTCEIEPNGAVCNDGDICTSASTCSAGVCVGTGRTPSGCGDAYMCYKASVTKGAVPFFQQKDQDISDAYGAGIHDVKVPRALCMPGSVDGSPVYGPDAHLVGYRVKESTNRPLPPGVEVTDRFGTITVDVQKTTMLLSTAGYALDTPATPLSPGIADEHECYRVKLSLGKYPKGTTADMAESLEDRTYRLLKPSQLCIAASSNGGPLLNPNAHLMCYRVSRDAGEPKHDKVRSRIRTVDEFGTLRLDTRREAELCVPATVDAPIL